VATVTSTKTAAKPGIGPGWPKPPGQNVQRERPQQTLRGRRKFSKDTYRIVVWILLAAIVMMFVALASSYIVLSEIRNGSRCECREHSFSAPDDSGQQRTMTSGPSSTGARV